MGGTSSKTEIQTGDQTGDQGGGQVVETQTQQLPSDAEKAVTAVELLTEASSKKWTLKNMVELGQKYLPRFLGGRSQSFGRRRRRVSRHRRRSSKSKETKRKRRTSRTKKSSKDRPRRKGRRSRRT